MKKNIVFGFLGLILLCACNREPAATRKNAGMSVRTDPAGAAIFVDNSPYGVSPCELQLESGASLLRVEKTGYRPLWQRIDLLPGKTIALDLKLTPIEGIVLFQSNAKDSEVVINNSFKGSTPLMLPNVPLGDHQVTISSPGYLPKTMDLKVTGGTPLLLQADLMPDSATLKVITDPEGATVLINGTNKGITPCTVSRVPSGKAEVRIQLDGYTPYTDELMMKIAQEEEIDISLTQAPGSLQVRSIPEGANVYIDNEYQGLTPYSDAKLSAGEYRLRIELKGYEAMARSISVQSTDSRSEEFRLKRNSGTLMLVTEPAGMKVIIDGEECGVTDAAGAGAISVPLKVDFLSMGSHSLQLVRQGYSYRGKKIIITPNKVTTLHEVSERIFIKDHVVTIRTADGKTKHYEGMLIKEDLDGNIELATSPGIVLPIAAKDIVAKKALN